MTFYLILNPAMNLKAPSIFITVHFRADQQLE